MLKSIGPDCFLSGNSGVDREIGKITEKFDFIPEGTD
jgi:hypothetical protein